MAFEDDRFGRHRTRIHYHLYDRGLRRRLSTKRAYLPNLPGNNGRQSGVQLLRHPSGGVLAVWLEKVGAHNHLAYTHIYNGSVRTPIDMIGGLEDFQRVELAIAKGTLYAVWEGDNARNQSVLWMAKMPLDNLGECNKTYAVSPNGQQREPHFVQPGSTQLGLVYSETAKSGDDVLKMKWLVR